MSDDLTRSSLLSRVASSPDDPAWEEFSRFYCSLIQRFAARCGLNLADGKDVTQETLVAISQSIVHFQKRPGVRFRSWVYGIAAHKVQDFRRAHFRRSRWETPAAGDGTGHAGGPNETATGNGLEKLWEAEWEGALTTAALERLRPELSTRQFQILHLFVAEGKPVAEIAETLDLLSTYVSVAKHRLLPRLRGKVNEVRREWGDGG